MIETVVPLECLEPFEQNPRLESGLDERKMLELKRDIRKRGLLTPLIVWLTPDERYVILAGHRRYKALLDIEPGDYPVPVRLVEAISAEQAHSIALADNFHRENLWAYEIMTALDAMGGTIDELHQRTNISKRRISRLLTIWNYADEETLSLLRFRQISENTAYERAHKQFLEKHNQDLKKERRRKEKRGPIPKRERVVPPELSKVDAHLPTAKQEGRRGPNRGPRKRPTINVIRSLLDRLPSPKGNYEEGLIDALNWVVRGYEPEEGRSQKRWDQYMQRARPDNKSPEGKRLLKQKAKKGAKKEAKQLNFGQK